MKRCSRCGKHKRLDGKVFSRSKSSKDGFYHRCKVCDREVKLKALAKERKHAQLPMQARYTGINATDEEQWIVAKLADRIGARMDGFKEGPCADDVLNALLPLPDPWTLDAPLLKRHCQLLSLASELAKVAR